MSDIKVTIIGVGGAGCNTINRLSSKKFKNYNLCTLVLKGVRFFTTIYNGLSEFFAQITKHF